MSTTKTLQFDVKPYDTFIEQARTKTAEKKEAGENPKGLTEAEEEIKTAKKRELRNTVEKCADELKKAKAEFADSITNPAKAIATALTTRQQAQINYDTYSELYESLFGTKAE